MFEIIIKDDPQIAASEKESSDFLIEAKRVALAVKDQESYESAGKFMLGIKSWLKKWIADQKGPIDKAKSLVKDLEMKRDRIADPCKRAEEILKKAIGDYEDEMIRKRREDDERKRKEALKREEDKRLSQATDLEKLGKREAADTLINMPVRPPAVSSAPAFTKVKGISSHLEYKFNVIDESLLPREYLIPDRKKIQSVVDAMKEHAAEAIPGIEVYSERVVSGRTA